MDIIAKAIIATFVLSACAAPSSLPPSDARGAAGLDGAPRMGATKIYNIDSATPTAPVIETVLTGLDNPRGVVVLMDGSLLVAEAGTGYDAVEPTNWTGKLSHFQDGNGDGDFTDNGERIDWFRHLPTYNALQFFATRRDEVNGPGDLLRHPDGRLFLSVDAGLDRIGLYEISPDRRIGRNLSPRSNMNGLAFSRDFSQIYLAESTANALSVVRIADGAYRQIVQFDTLANGQQSVPAGLAVDPRNGDVLVALFSGAVAVNGEVIPFMPGAGKIVRVDPSTGTVEDAVTGLTTSIDVAIDRAGSIFVVEMTSGYADLLDRTHDLFDPDQPALHGGYLRYSGRVSRYLPGGSAPHILADGLDMPTNITLAPDGAVYISTGQGTPSRPIPGPDGPTRIVGKVIRIRI